MCRGKGKMTLWLVLVMVVFCLGAVPNPAAAAFDVRQHLCTVTRYADALKVEGDGGRIPPLPEPPSGCRPIHINLVARHGTRNPTFKKAKALDALAAKLRSLAEEDGGQHLPEWCHDYRSPWEGSQSFGFLLEEGETEMYELGRRLRKRFPELFEASYNPDTYPILATQVPRSSVSAVAFGMGLFEAQGRVGKANHRAFAVVSDSKDVDRRLRFHKTCPAYKVHKQEKKSLVDKVQAPVFAAVKEGLQERWGLKLSEDEVADLWVLCKQEAALLDVTDRACALFTNQEVMQLEWADDAEVHLLKGYGAPINYRMARPLLADIVQSIDDAVEAASTGGNGKATERARLRVAHAETVIPFTCTLGLFLENATQAAALTGEEQLLPTPPAPPHSRNFKGSRVAPMGANTALVLYHCDEAHKTNKTDADFRVLALHNERPVAMPACDGELFCPLDVFKAKVVGPHLKHQWENTCEIEGPRARLTQVLDPLVERTKGENNFRKWLRGWWEATLQVVKWDTYAESGRKKDEIEL